jgi:hypothetical protein
LTNGLPLPIISAAIVRGGADPEAIRASELASVYTKLGWRMSVVAWWPKRCSGPTMAACWRSTVMEWDSVRGLVEAEDDSPVALGFG